MTEPTNSVELAPAPDDLSTAPRPGGGTTAAGRPTTSLRTSAFVRALRLGRLAIAAQLIWLLGFSLVQYSRGGLTHDFALYDQARWLIVHGHWTAYDTVLGAPFWQNNGEALMWPLAQLTRLPGGGLWLLLLQSAAIAAGNWVALSWVADWVSLAPARHRATSANAERPALGPTTAISLTAVLLVLNPWVYDSAAFDVHFESFAVLFALLAARELWRGRRRVWLWVILAVSAGEIGGLLLLGVGAGALLARRGRRWRPALGVILAGVAWLGLVTLLHGDKGPYENGVYTYLANGPAYSGPAPSPVAIVSGVVEHPGRVLADLSANQANLWANLAPAGLIGLVNPWTAGVALAVLASGALAMGPSGHIFSQPGFQNLPVYPFVTVGSVMLLVRIGRDNKASGLRGLAARGTRPAAAVLCALSLAWAAVWLPRYPSTWLRVTPAGGRALARARDLIPSDAEVIASQGIAGRFSDRAAIYPLMSVPATLPISGTSVYIVLAPAQGIEMPVQEGESVLAQVASTLGARLLEHRAGIWVWRWNPPRNLRSVTFQGAQDLVAAWTLPSLNGVASTSGPPSLWHLAGDGRRGYVASGDYWYETAGSYQASAEISSTGPVDVQVWDANTATLLAQRQLGASPSPETVDMPFNQTVPGPQHVFSGWGPLAIDPVSPPPGQPIEIRVYDPGGSLINVYSVGVSPVTSP